MGVFEWGFEKRRLFGVVFWMVNRGDLVVSCGVLDGAFSEAKNTPIFEIYFWDGQSSIRMWDWLTGWGRSMGKVRSICGTSTDSTSISRFASMNIVLQ